MRHPLLRLVTALAVASAATPALPLPAAAAGVPPAVTVATGVSTDPAQVRTVDSDDRHVLVDEDGALFNRTDGSETAVVEPAALAGLQDPRAPEVAGELTVWAGRSAGLVWSSTTGASGSSATAFDPDVAYAGAVPGGWLLSRTGLTGAQLVRVDALSGAESAFAEVPAEIGSTGAFFTAYAADAARAVYLTSRLDPVDGLRRQGVVVVALDTGVVTFVASRQPGASGAAALALSAQGAAWYDGQELTYVPFEGPGGFVVGSLRGAQQGIALSATAVLASDLTLVPLDDPSQPRSIANHDGTPTRSAPSSVGGRLLLESGESLITYEDGVTFRSSRQRHMSTDSVSVTENRVVWADDRERDGPVWLRSLTPGTSLLGPERRVSRDTVARPVKVGPSSGLGTVVQQIASTRIQRFEADGTDRHDNGSIDHSPEDVALSGLMTVYRLASTTGPPVVRVRHLGSGQVATVADPYYAIFGTLLVTARTDGSVWRKSLPDGKALSLLASTPGVHDVQLLTWGDRTTVSDPTRPAGQRNLLLTTVGESTVAERLGDQLRPVALSSDYLVSYDATTSALVARNLSNGLRTTVDTAPRVPHRGSVSIAGSTLAWISSDGEPKLRQLPPVLTAPRFLRGPATTDSTGFTGALYSDWYPEFPFSEPLPTCSITLANAARIVRTISCANADGSGRPYWDRLDEEGQAVPDGRYTWTVTGSGPGGRLVDVDGVDRPLTGAIVVAGSPAPKRVVTVQVETPDAGRGRVTSDPPGISCTDRCQASFPPDVDVTLVMTPVPGSQPFYWFTGAAGSAPTCYGQARCLLPRASSVSAVAYVRDQPPQVQDYTPGITSVTAPWRVTFDEDVTSVTTGNLQLRDLDVGRTVPARLTCTTLAGRASSCTGPARTATLTPFSPLAARGTYAISINPAGATTKVKDLGGRTATTRVLGGAYTARTARESDAAMAWGAVSDSRANGGRYVRESRTGAAFTYTWSGRGLRYWFTRGPDQGRARVTVDGVVVDSALDQYAASRQRSFRTYTTMPGPHRIVVTVLGTRRAAATGTFVSVDSFSDHDSTCVTSSGCVTNPSGAVRWASVAVTGASGGRTVQSSTAGASLTWRFAGSRFDLRRLVGPTQGYLSISVDGRAATLHNGYRSKAGFASIVRSGLSSGRHTVTIRVLHRTGRAGAAAYGVGLDRLTATAD